MQPEEYICTNPNCGPVSSCCANSKGKFFKKGGLAGFFPDRGCTTVCVSLYGNPIHRGHIDYLGSAWALGDFVIAIVNNDRQVKFKGATPFMDEAERLIIVGSIKWVDMAVLSIDKDRSVSKTIEELSKRYKINIFANGGDEYNKDNCAETAICEKLGIEMMFGVGGPKVQSSSELLRKRNHWELNNFTNIVNEKFEEIYYHGVVTEYTDKYGCTLSKEEILAKGLPYPEEYPIIPHDSTFLSKERLAEQ